MWGHGTFIKCHWGMGEGQGESTGQGFMGDSVRAWSVARSGGVASGADIRAFLLG